MAVTDDLFLVLKALGDYERTTHRKRIALGGWSIEDDALHPPEPLMDALRRLPPDLTTYADVYRCYGAKAQAADLFSRCIRIQGEALTSDHLAVLPSGSNGILLALTFLRDHGIHTLYVSAPGYFATFQVCKHLGLRAEIIPPKDFLTCQLDYDRIAQALHTPGSALTLTNPAYSVGVEYSPSDLARLFAVIPEQTYVLLDEVYSGLNWEHDEPWMPYDSPCRVMILRSPSKTFLMYGSKLCFLVAPPAVIQYVETLAEFLSSLPGNFENIALEYLYALSAWEQENLQPGNGTYRRWKAQTTVCFTRNLQRLIPLLEEFRFLVAPINSGPYVTVATERARLNGFDPVALARQHGVLFMTSQHYFHEDPQWFGFRLNLCGDSHEFDKALRSVLPLFLTR